METAATESDWQSWAALAVVAATVFVLVLRAVLKSRRKRKGGGCGKCGSGDCH